MRVQYGWIFMSSFFQVVGGNFLIVPSHNGERMRELSGASFIRALILFMKAPLPYYLPKFPPLDIIILVCEKVGFYHINLKGRIHSVQNRGDILSIWQNSRHMVGTQ